MRQADRCPSHGRFRAVAVLCLTALLIALSASAEKFSLPAPPREEVSDGRVRNSVWGIHFEAPGYEVWEDHRLRRRPEFVAAGQWQENGCEVKLSLFAPMIEAGTSAAACRARYAGSREQLEADDSFVIRAIEDGPVAWSRYDQKHEAGLVQSQLYAYAVRDETCFVLHASAMSCDRFDPIASPILESLTVEPRPDVNMETVAVARSLKKAPTHWRVHQVIAGSYLHDASPPNPGRARAYYQNALRLAGDDLRAGDAWLIQEGIGLTWLDEDDGASAVAPLEKALALAREQSATDKVGSSLYNLACAHALAGDLEKACASAAESLEGLSGKERRKQLKEMRNDPQLRALREAKCVKGL